jgi:hypothetical protein
VLNQRIGEIADTEFGAFFERFESLFQDDVFEWYGRINDSIWAVNETLLGMSVSPSPIVGHIQGFASGGVSDGYPIIVGERGPELLDVGPSRIYSHSDTRSLLNTDELVSEIRKLRETVEKESARNRALTDRIRKLLDEKSETSWSVTVAA